MACCFRIPLLWAAVAVPSVLGAEWWSIIFESSQKSPIFNEASRLMREKQWSNDGLAVRFLGKFEAEYAAYWGEVNPWMARDELESAFSSAGPSSLDLTQRKKDSWDRELFASEVVFQRAVRQLDELLDYSSPKGRDDAARFLLAKVLERYDRTILRKEFSRDFDRIAKWQAMHFKDDEGAFQELKERSARVTRLEKGEFDFKVKASFDRRSGVGTVAFYGGTDPTKEIIMNQLLEEQRLTIAMISLSQKRSRDPSADVRAERAMIAKAVGSRFASGVERNELPLMAQTSIEYFRILAAKFGKCNKEDKVKIARPFTTGLYWNLLWHGVVEESSWAAGEETEKALEVTSRLGTVVDRNGGAGYEALISRVAQLAPKNGGWDMARLAATLVLLQDDTDVAQLVEEFARTKQLGKKKLSKLDSRVAKVHRELREQIQWTPADQRQSGRLGMHFYLTADNADLRPEVVARAALIEKAATEIWKWRMTADSRFPPCGPETDLRKLRDAAWEGIALQVPKYEPTDQEESSVIDPTILKARSRGRSLARSLNGPRPVEDSIGQIDGNSSGSSSSSGSDGESSISSSSSSSSDEEGNRSEIPSRQRKSKHGTSRGFSRSRIQSDTFEEMSENVKSRGVLKMPRKSDLRDDRQNRMQSGGRTRKWSLAFKSDPEVRLFKSDDPTPIYYPEEQPRRPDNHSSSSMRRQRSVRWNMDSSDED